MTNWLRKVFQLILIIGFISPASAGVYEDFFRAVEVDNAQTVMTLLNRGFDPNARDEKGQVALYLAYRAGSIKVAQAILGHPDVKPDLRNEHGETPMMMAALRGLREEVARLLDRGVPPHQEGWSPLHYAASSEEGAPVVQLLLNRGAKTEARAPNGNTPLMMAARYGSEKSVDLLLAAGADPKARNQREMTVVEFARGGGREPLALRLEPLAR